MPRGRGEMFCARDSLVVDSGSWYANRIKKKERAREREREEVSCVV